MYFASGRFKNVVASIDKMVLKQEIAGIKNNDILLLFDDGWCVHKKTNTQVQTASLPATSEKEMRMRVKKFFTKASKIIYKAGTQLQYEQAELKGEMPTIIKRHPELFRALVTQGGAKGKFNISSKYVANILKKSKDDAKEFMRIGVKQGVFKKDYSSWSVTDEIWNKIRIMYASTDFTIRPIDEHGNVIKRTGHDDAEIARGGLRNLVSKYKSNADEESEVKLHTKKTVSRIDHVSHTVTANKYLKPKKKKGLSNEHGKLYSEEEAKDM